MTGKMKIRDLGRDIEIGMRQAKEMFRILDRETDNKL